MGVFRPMNHTSSNIHVCTLASFQHTLSWNYGEDKFEYLRHLSTCVIKRRDGYGHTGKVGPRILGWILEP